MIKYIYKLTLLLVAIVLSVGCADDFLDRTPTDSISAGDALSTPENMALILNGLHRLMYSQGELPGSSRSTQHFMMPAFDGIAGNVIHSSPGNGWHRSEIQWLTHTNETYTTVNNLWYYRYHFIASTNAIINAVETEGMTIDADMNNVLGQAHAYRAWAYFDLVTTYCKPYLTGTPSTDPGVPISYLTTDPYLSSGRSTVDSVYTTIGESIDKSIAYFEAGATEAVNKSHLSLNVAYGLKARIALQTGDWSTAATYAAKAKEGYPLLDHSDILSGFNTYDLSEVMWGSNVIDTETTYYQSFFYFMGTNFNGTQNRGNPKLISKELYEQMGEDDIRREHWIPEAPITYSLASNGQGGFGSDDFPNDVRYQPGGSVYVAINADSIAAADGVDVTEVIEDQYWSDWEDVIVAHDMTTSFNTHSYMSAKFKNKTPGGIAPDDLMHMRSSEMYLIEAEALTMANDITGAQAILSEFVLTRDSGFDVSLYSTQDALLEEIKFHRNIELWGEGFGYKDKRRWDEGIDHTNSGASSTLYNDAFYQEKPSINSDWIWQIPEDEINANPYISAEDQN